MVPAAVLVTRWVEQRQGWARRAWWWAWAVPWVWAAAALVPGIVSGGARLPGLVQLAEAARSVRRSVQATTVKMNMKQLRHVSRPWTLRP